MSPCHRPNDVGDFVTACCEIPARGHIGFASLLAYGTGLSRVTPWVTQSDDFLAALARAGMVMGFITRKFDIADETALLTRHWWLSEKSFDGAGAAWQRLTS